MQYRVGRGISLCCCEGACGELLGNSRGMLETGLRVRGFDLWETVLHLQAFAEFP